MIILLLSWVLLILAGVKYAPKNQYYNKILIQQQSTVLRGICAVEIMFGHIGIATGSLLLYPNRKAGILFVGIFFMLSGYGLSYGVSHKETYLDHFLLKKMLKILIPAVIIWIVARGVQMLLDPPIHNITSFFESTNWYVWEILGYYICFWLVYKLLRQIIGKCKWGGGIILGCTILFVGIAYQMKLTRPWYGSTLCLPLGIFYQQYEVKWEKFLQPKLWKLILLFLVEGIAMVIFFLTEGTGALGDVVARNVAAVVFCMIVCSFLYKIQLYNPVSYWLGKCSYEIYLIHFYVISILQQYISNKILFSIGIIMITLFLAFIAFFLKMFIKSRLERIT